MSLWIVLQCVVNLIPLTLKVPNRKQYSCNKNWHADTHGNKHTHLKPILQNIQASFCFKDFSFWSGFRWHFLYLCMLWMRCIITLFLMARSIECLLSSHVCLHGKVNLIFCGNVLTETVAALYSTISTAAVSVLLLSGGQGWRLHFKWKPWWNSNRKYRQIWAADRALRDTLSFKSHSW